MAEFKVLHGGQYIDARKGELRRGDIVVKDGIITEIYKDGYPNLESLSAHQKIDVTDKTISPGFVNTHVHLESGISTPMAGERLTLSRGTTTVMWDPHEIANVKGVLAFKFAISCAQITKQDIFIGLSSCVPAVPGLGTSGAVITAEDMKPFLNNPYVYGLAEVMNIPAVTNNDPEMMAKLALFKNIDGHFANITDPDVIRDAVKKGIRNDHECIGAEEAQLKIDLGLDVFIREGTAAKNLKKLVSLLKPKNYGRVAFCTDDRHPVDIVKEGDIDNIIRQAIDLYDPADHGDDFERYMVCVYQAATLWGAEHFGLTDRGVIEIGKKADLVVLDDMKTCAINSVYKDGELVNDALFDVRPDFDMTAFSEFYNSVVYMGRDQVKPEDFDIKAKTSPASHDGAALHTEQRNVIGLLPDEIVTQALTSNLPVDIVGHVQADISDDILKIAVLERHGKSEGVQNEIGLSFVKGFGFKNGAIASSVGHDDHNVIVAGDNDFDMAKAANRIQEMGGGFVLVRDGDVLAELALPLAGLISDLEDSRELAKLEEKLLQACDEAGFNMRSPFMSLAFLALPVIGDAKVTNKGETRFNPAEGFEYPQLVA